MSPKRSLKYCKNSQGRFECSLCRATFSARSNARKHIKEVHEKKEKYSIFTYKGKRILKSTEQLLIWKASHGISMRALNDDLILDLLPPESLFSEKTNQRILNEMCNQIIDINYSNTSKRPISLIMDGGTVNHIKWLAVGYFYRTLNEAKFQVLDIFVFETATAVKIKKMVECIASRIKNVHKGNVVACCTDNASNFKKVFLDSETDNTSFIPLDILRVSCSCHTIQLVLKDLKSKDSSYKKLIKLMKIIPVKMSFLSRKDIQKLHISSFPPLQKQRWNSVYKTLDYIIHNLHSLSSLFSEEELDFLQIFDLTELFKELAPINEFTKNCEADKYNQSKVYIEYRALESKLEVINTPRAQTLLDLIHTRFQSTADIDLARLCYFTTNQGLKEKQERFPHIPLISIDPDDQEANQKYDNELDFITSFKKTLEKTCSKLHLNFDVTYTAFSLLMKHYSPPDNDIESYPKAEELKELLKKHVSDKKYYISLSKLIEILQVLPASEAGAERIFARMRDLFNKKQTRMSAVSLRSNLIVSFYQNENNFDDYIEDYYDMNKEEESDNERVTADDNEYDS